MSSSMTPELRAPRALTCRLCPGAPQKNLRILAHRAGGPTVRSLPGAQRPEKQGACPGKYKFRGHPPDPMAPGHRAPLRPLGAHHLLSPVSSPHPPLMVREPGTYQDKEQKSWGKEAKSHLHSGVGPFSFAPLKFQIPVCGQSHKFLTI